MDAGITSQPTARAAFTITSQKATADETNQSCRYVAVALYRQLEKHMDIRVDDLSNSATQSLLRLHLAGMHSNSPPGHVFALDLSGLTSPDVTVWSAWSGDDICGIGALKQLDARSGEIKSMRTHPNYLRQGVASALLEHIIEEAQACGLQRLSLETGSGPSFEPALALYRRRGFVNGEAFSDYEQSSFNQFLHLSL
jgi:putative acetyltransferase